MERTLACVLLFLVPFTVHAVMLTDLYEAEAPVIDQSDKNRQAAVRTALGQVLVKLTGDRSSPGNPALSPILKLAPELVQQYLYREQEPVNTAAGVDTGPTTRLWVRFDERILAQRMWELGIPIWGQERPATLLWLASEDDSGRFFVSQDSLPEFISVLENKARLRGIALVFPLLDLEDSTRIRADEVWDGFRQPILDASARYGADSVLAGRIHSPTPGIWEAGWTVYFGEEGMNWVTRSDLAEMALEEGIDGLADALAARYVISGALAGAELIRITVTEITTNDQYAATIKYLRSLNSVTDVQVVQVEPGQVSFAVTAHGGEPAISQAITLGRRLLPMDNTGRRIYRLLP